MKCVIPGPNVKVLGRAIHSLAKLGDELYLEGDTSELSFRTTNASKTAYATFQFSINFFSFFDFEGTANSNSNLKCQISMKSSLSVFRSPVTLDRTVDSLQIQLDPTSDNLIFLMKYRKGFIKTFHVPVIECEVLQASYQKEKALNKLIVQPKIVCDILSNFQHNLHEITWKATKDNLIIRNYSESENCCPGVRTEITVKKGEFDEYKISNETEITFCLKELKAVLLFSDTVILPLTVYFITQSKPIIFAVKGEVFEADFVVSTLSGSDSTNSQNEAEERSQEEFRNDEQNDELLSNMQLDEPDILLNAVGTPTRNNTQEDNERREKREKLQQVFQRCFEQEKFDLKKLPGYNVVLASDSDSEASDGS